MAKNKRTSPLQAIGLSSPASEEGPRSGGTFLSSLKRRKWIVAIVFFVSIGALGAGLKYLDENAKTEKKLVAKDRSLISSVNPFASAPFPDPTPQLSKEYVYAGSRLLAVEDKNASAVPPADLAIWRPTTGVWWVRISGTEWITHGWGEQGDIPVPGDFDGDGTTDFSIWRPNNYTWYVIYSSTGGYYIYQFGEATDKPAPADYNGDGKTDVAVFRPSTGTWYIHTGSSYYTDSLASSSTDLPAPADYDGDGKADLGIFRTDRTFKSKNSSNQEIVTINPNFDPSYATWIPVSSDYDGDGKADYAVYDSYNGKWYIRSSISGVFPSTPVSWGQSGDKPVPNDYDSDSKCDYAIWRPSNGTWYIVQSADNYSQRQTQWGQSGDEPVPAFYRR